MVPYIDKLYLYQWASDHPGQNLLPFCIKLTFTSHQQVLQYIDSSYCCLTLKPWHLWLWPLDRGHIDIFWALKKQKNMPTIFPLQMRPPSDPKVVPWDQIFFLLKKPLYIVYFRHMNREHFWKKPKTGQPAVALRFWAWVIKISILGHL